MKQTLNSFLFALRGLANVWKEEKNFRIATLCGGLVVLLATYLNFSFVEYLFCIVSITIVLFAEIVNTVVEDICDKVEPNQDSTIGKIKDMSSAFVLVSCIGAFVVGLVVFFHHFS